jgi:hypothetical protein
VLPAAHACSAAHRAALQDGRSVCGAGVPLHGSPAQQCGQQSAMLPQARSLDAAAAGAAQLLAQALTRRG